MAQDLNTLLEEARCLECEIPPGLVPYQILTALRDLSGGGGGGACTITTTELPDGTEGEPYSSEVEANAPATFAVTSGALPDGLTLNPDGTITGTPTEGIIGSFSFTVTATTADATCTKDLGIDILESVFEPPQLADLVVWVKPETLSGLADNDPVDVWPDSGLRGNDYQEPSAPEAPTWDAGAGAVRFNGANQYLRSSAVGTTNTQYTIFIALKFDSATGTQGVMRVGDLTGGYGFYKDTGNRGVIHRAVAACTNGSATTDTEVWSAVRTEGPNLLRFFVNGVQTVISNSTSNVNAPDGSAMYIGIFATAAFLYMAGLVYEMLIYEVPLSDANRETVDNYLISEHVP